MNLHLAGNKEKLKLFLKQLYGNNFISLGIVSHIFDDNIWKRVSPWLVLEAGLYRFWLAAYLVLYLWISETDIINSWITVGIALFPSLILCTSENILRKPPRTCTACHIAGSGYKIKVGRHGEAAGAITSSKKSFTLYQRFLLNSWWRFAFCV